MIKGLANAMKNYQGKVDGMKTTHFLQKKIEFEKEFQAWAEADPARKAKYGDILAKEKKQYKVIAKTKDRDNVFRIFGGLSGTTAVARQVYGLSKEMQSRKQTGNRAYEEAVQQSRGQNEIHLHRLLRTG